jgi:hypothetical protein
MAAARPVHSALTSERGLMLPSFDDALARYLRNANRAAALWPGGRSALRQLILPAAFAEYDGRQPALQQRRLHVLYMHSAHKHYIYWLHFFSYTALHSVTLRNLVYTAMFGRMFAVSFDAGRPMKLYRTISAGPSA